MRQVLLTILAATLIAIPAAGRSNDTAFAFPPGIIRAGRVIESDNPGTICQDVYARTVVQYKTDPTQRCRREGWIAATFAGWRISQVPPDRVGPCYSHAQCVREMWPATWWPVTRLAESETTVLGADIKAQTRKCPAGRGGLLPTQMIVGIPASAPCGTDLECIREGIRQNIVYGFDTDDPDGPGPLTPLAVTPELPCGLPYRYTAISFLDEAGSPDRLITRLFKIVVFEQWFRLYWRYDSGHGAYESPVLANFPQLFVIPLFPRVAEIDFHRRFTGGGTLQGTDVAGTDDRTLRVLLDGDYTIEDGLMGDGLIVVTGSLTVRGAFEYRGSVFVQSTLTLLPERRLHHGPRDRRPATD